MTSLAKSEEEGLRIRAAVLWTMAGLLVFGSHTAFALVFLSWSRPVPTSGEPPAAIMIDLPANMPGLTAQPRAADGIDIQREEYKTVASMPADSTATAPVDKQTRDGSLASTKVAQLIPLPTASTRTAAAKARKLQKLSRKTNERDHRPVTRQHPILSPLENAGKPAIPAAGFAKASTGAAHARRNERA